VTQQTDMQTVIHKRESPQGTLMREVEEKIKQIEGMATEYNRLSDEIKGLSARLGAIYDALAIEVIDLVFNDSGIYPADDLLGVLVRQQTLTNEEYQRVMAEREEAQKRRGELLVGLEKERSLLVVALIDKSFPTPVYSQLAQKTPFH
jgi:hypothetical protein